MSSPKPLMLLLGSGSNIGQAVARKFEAGGYNVAIAARSLPDRKVSDKRWSYTIDLSNPNAVAETFAKVTNDIGIPNVVVYNAASLVQGAGDHPFTVPVQDFENSIKVNTISTYAAAKCAIEGFSKLPKSTLKSFIFTGNILNTSPMPRLWTLGVGKSASAHIIQSAAILYADSGYRFYYADERREDGSPVLSAVNGQAHADHFFELAAQLEQGPWLSTFVKDKGYVQFQ